MRGRGLLGAAAALAVASLLPVAKTQARPPLYNPLYLESFETDLGLWGPSGFNGRPIQITQSTVVASSGTGSMAVTQDGPGFSWNTKAEGNASNLNALYQAFNAASTLPESQVYIEFDVIYHHADIPDDPNFINLSVYENNDGGFRQVDSLGLDDGVHIQQNIDQTVHVAFPVSAFSGFGDKIPSNANFYQLGWSLNRDGQAGNGTAGDGIGDMTVYFDDVAITVVPEPVTAGALGLVGLAALRRRRG